VTFAILGKRMLKSVMSISGLEKQTIELLVRFYRFYGYKCKYQLILLFIGAIISGLIEVLGLILLYILIRLLIDIKSFEEGHFVLKFFSLIGVEDRDMMIPFFGASILVIFILKNIYSVIYYHLQHLILRRWKAGISTYLMSRYLHAPYVFLLRYNSATIIRNVNATVGAALNGFVLSALNYGSNIIAGLIILSLLCIRYMGVTLLIGAVLLITTALQNRFLKKKQFELGKEKEELATEQTKTVYQGLHAIKETKVVGREAHFVEIFENVNNRTIDNEMKSLFYTRLPSHLTEITVIIAILIITVTVLMDTAGNVALSISSLGVLGGIAFRLAPIMNKVISSMQTINKNTYPMQNLFREIERLNSLQLITAQRDDVEALPFQNKIKLNNVSFKYPGTRVYAIQKATFSIKKGEFVGIVGSSGAGKTTLVDILLGLLTPLRGEIWVDDQLVAAENVRSWQKNIGYVPQSVYMGETSIAENIAFGVKKEEIDYGRIKTILKDVKLDGYVDGLAEGLEFNVGENGKNLSGGQKQRLGIARALYLQADVLVLDEATSSLDVPTEVQISDAINSIRGQKTIFVIAHRLSTVFNSDKIIYVDDSKIVDIGSYNDLYERNQNFKELANLARVVPDAKGIL
jgi:ATP-binding cassette, subfamily B, bacterial PglK